MFIVTITDADGMTYVEAFNSMGDARKFIPPAWARLKTPTKRKCVRYSFLSAGSCAAFGVGERLHV